MFARSRLGVALLLSAALTAGGCTFARVTTQEVPPGMTDDLRAYHARHLTVEDGETTRDQLRRLLGTPDYLVENGGREVAYRWQAVRYEKSYPDYFNRDPEEGVPAKVVYHSLLLRFDDAGVVAEHRKFRHKVEYGGPPSLPDLVDVWQRERASR